MKRLMLSLIFALFLIVCGCGPTTVALVHPQSGDQAVCPFPVGQTGIGSSIVISKEDLEAFAKMTPTERELWYTKRCVQGYEAKGYVRVDSGAPIRSYHNPTYRWSISYPGNWMIDTGDVGWVKVTPPLAMPRGLCGIISTMVSYQTVDELTDFLTADTERLIKKRGGSMVVVSRGPIFLQSNISSNDVLVEIRLPPGGKSRRVYVLTGGRGLVIDCESNAKDWDKLESYFDWIIRSFKVSN